MPFRDTHRKKHDVLRLYIAAFHTQTADGHSIIEASRYHYHDSLFRHSHFVLILVSAIVALLDITKFSFINFTGH
jgi:hypothetical protein